MGYIYIGGLMGDIYIYILYTSKKVATFSLWTVCPCFFSLQCTNSVYNSNYTNRMVHFSESIK